ncbi:MAG: T9SS type A sorting domain-containing protein [Bacteroidales bacterium]|nr:T9SS type A sorting domain-containing protein [Bacteroidales bacterium]
MIRILGLLFIVFLNKSIIPQSHTSLIYYPEYLTATEAKDTELEMNVVEQFHLDNYHPTLGLAYDGECLWFFDIAKDSLIAIDKITGEKVNGFPLPITTGMYSLTFDGEYFWVSSSGYSIYKLSHENGNIIMNFQLPYSPITSGIIRGLVWKDNLLWCYVSEVNYAVIVGIDVENVICTDTIVISNSFGIGGLTYMNGYFWVNDNFEYKIRKVDPENGLYEAWFPHYYLCSGSSITTDGEYMYCSDTYFNIFKYEILDNKENFQVGRINPKLKNSKTNIKKRYEIENWYKVEKSDEVSMNLVDHFHYDYLSTIRGLAYDEENIWFSDCARDSLFSIDKNTGEKITGFPFPTDTDIYGLTFDGEYIWASTQHHLHKIDPETGLEITSFHIPYNVTTNSVISGLAWYNNNLYCTLTSGYSSMIVGVDVNNIACIDAFSSGNTPSPSGLTHMNGYLWINDYSSIKIKKIDPEYFGQVVDWSYHYYLCYPLVGLTNDGEYLYCSDDYCNIYKYELADTTTNIVENRNSFPDKTTFKVYPNPAVNKINLDFYLSYESIIKIDIFNMKGVLKKEIISDKQYPIGRHCMNWKIEDLDTSEYIIRLTTNNNILCQKLLIVN